MYEKQAQLQSQQKQLIPQIAVINADVEVQQKKKKKKKVKKINKTQANEVKGDMEQWNNAGNPGTQEIIDFIDSEIENEEHMPEWGAADFKPKRNYEVPSNGLPKSNQVMPNANLHQNKSARPNPTQAANEYLLQRVQDPAYQQKLFNNDFVNGV